MADRDTVKISMTLTVETSEWVQAEYPESQSTQEAIRMALSDARKYCRAIENANTHIQAD